MSLRANSGSAVYMATLTNTPLSCRHAFPFEEETSVGEKKEKKRDPWLEAFRRTRKEMPPPTRVKPGKKGKGVRYRREKEEWEENGESE